MNSASKDRINEIESWFRACEGGEFCVAPADFSSVRIGEESTAKTIIYATKPRCLPRIKSISELPKPIATLGRAGLPTSDDLPFVLGSGDSRHRIFIGDADPPDLLAYAWLREHIPIVWHGVNDDFLSRHNTRHLDWIQVPLSDVEREILPLLARLCPDYRVLLGEYCSSLLESGMKIEIEGATIAGSASCDT